MKILIDMNLSPIWGKALKEAGIESVHWSELGPATTPDPAIMAFAAANGLTILTTISISGPRSQLQTGTSQASCRFAATTFGQRPSGCRFARRLAR